MGVKENLVEALLRANEGARYYGGPAYEAIAPKVRSGAELIASMLPGADMMDMANSSRDLMASRTPGQALENLGWLGTSLAGILVPANAGAIRDQLRDLKLYHGTINPDVASGKVPLKIGAGERRTDFGNFGDAIYGTPKEYIAKAYSEKGGQRGGVLSFNAPLRNPLYISVTGPEYTKEVESVAKELGVKAKPIWEGSGQRSADFAREFREKAVAAGYDGVVSLDADGNIGAEIAVFDDSLVKRGK